MKTKEPKWRDSNSLRSYKAIVDKAVLNSEDGATVTLDIGTAKALSDVIAQAMHTEIGHGN